MTNQSRRPAAIILAAAALAIAGCQDNKSSSSADAAPNAPKPVLAAPAGTPVPTDTTRLKSGAAPLTYMLGPGGNIRVLDLDTGKVIAKATAPLQAVITVNEATGVTVADKVVKAGPLPAGHRYELWLDKK